MVKNHAALCLFNARQDVELNDVHTARLSDRDSTISIIPDHAAHQRRHDDSHHRVISPRMPESNADHPVTNSSHMVGLTDDARQARACARAAPTSAWPQGDLLPCRTDDATMRVVVVLAMFGTVWLGQLPQPLLEAAVANDVEALRTLAAHALAAHVNGVIPA